MKKGFTAIVAAVFLIIILDAIFNLTSAKTYPEYGTYTGVLYKVDGEDKSEEETFEVSFNSGNYELIIEGKKIADGKYRLINDKIKFINSIGEVSDVSHVFDGSFKRINSGTLFVLERTLDEIVYRLHLEKNNFNEEI
ncbi:hypothetical protein OO013_00680 [Mangrovivirga sp. M17]|uniref:Uncharacterized protein n=1 Tax=Mangrovivirga halotolerans TaxID=2993936 RepID=A0ABT3RKX3_9BACT|nr:hypothetical protein [Mangrovivirga halotolerans]MCX2742354.1 hypothetical protein [Mangrovivirga halotolerans]